ncbi:class I SAM-dependent methyltransferase [Halovulum dunhuangense]|uniref:Class I SAM-dependent methyltransferase n=1 Tax=Halovulum dunhuangense TaxID=1505036 RepID=A0A849L3J4_9RHOB|nr:class I SAM-dependent methyltransferase [Halovulum dunhuangense]NNU80772.1 class I SAM-dependent methyltransferase [Halovulum dunhuangense]
MAGARLTEVREIWESAAPGWAKWEATLTSQFSDVTDTLIDMAGVRPGMRVLDVACGAGSTSQKLAQRVGSRGRVVASDISARMLEYLRQSAAEAGIDTIETLECAAESLGDAPGPFDAAVCRLGLMLFPAPDTALQGVRRVLAPGARFAALVFTTPQRNPYMAQPLGILMRHAGKSPPPPGQPGIFALGAEGMLARMIGDAGFEDIETRTLQAELRLPDAAVAQTMMQDAFGVFRALVAGLSPEERARAWDEVAECLARFETDRGFEAQFEFVLASGARPA